MKQLSSFTYTVCCDMIVGEMVKWGMGADRSFGVFACLEIGQGLGQCWCLGWTQQAGFKRKSWVFITTLLAAAGAQPGASRASWGRSPGWHGTAGARSSRSSCRSAEGGGADLGLLLERWDKSVRPCPWVLLSGEDLQVSLCLSASTGCVCPKDGD